MIRIVVCWGLSWSSLILETRVAADSYSCKVAVKNKMQQSRHSPESGPRRFTSSIPATERGPPFEWEIPSKDPNSATLILGAPSLNTSNYPIYPGDRMQGQRGLTESRGTKVPSCSAQPASSRYCQGVRMMGCKCHAYYPAPPIPSQRSPNWHEG